MAERNGSNAPVHLSKTIHNAACLNDVCELHASEGSENSRLGPPNSSGGGCDVSVDGRSWSGSNKSHLCDATSCHLRASNTGK
jgi:hypothetical protein